MATRHLTIILLFGTLITLGQGNADCFIEARVNQEIAINKIVMTSVGGSISIKEILSVCKATSEKIVGCKYPDSTLITVTDDSINIDNIKSDFVILNFNNLQDKNSLKQLDDLNKIKNESKNSCTIISVFAANKKDIRHLANKYKKNIEFVSNSGEYIKNNNLGLGTVTTFLLDKNKIIKYVAFGSHPDAGRLYTELVQYLK